MCLPMFLNKFRKKLLYSCIIFQIKLILQRRIAQSIVPLLQDIFVKKEALCSLVDGNLGTFRKTRKV